ncbi:hypothetical protein U0C82_07750 [Fulvimarina sp. 2208YS6-2-32]|uniref:Uncharacterized protein n=1 Tax=Fulvimarina uroteuthidis TaxID=3098149 RepID=A0ABU5I0W9_9HYPH|nr:hypothetical protein [Fulvimarina sp. 2208YS6-2-32]MDY8109036.1 hypothetical protein [Fulvimarina sp. 2208YS6-2-32]
MRSLSTLSILLITAAGARAHEVAVTHTHMGAFDTIGLLAVLAAAVGFAGFSLVRRNSRR